MLDIWRISGFYVQGVEHSNVWGEISVNPIIFLTINQDDRH